MFKMDFPQKVEHIQWDLNEKLLLEAENHYKKHNNFSKEILQHLYLIHGDTLEDALDILDNGKLVRYQPEKGVRCFYVVMLRMDRFTLFDNVNFCFCTEFRERVLGAVELRDLLTCRHVLAVKFAKITGKIIESKLKEDTFSEMLSNAKVFADD